MFYGRNPYGFGRWWWVNDDRIFIFEMKCSFKSLELWKGNLWAIPLPFGLNFLLHFFLLYFFLSLFFTSTSSLSMDCHLSPGCLWICQYVYMYCCSSSHTLSSSTPALGDYKLHDTWSQFQAYPQTPSSFLEAEKAGHDRTRCLHENTMSCHWKKKQENTPRLSGYAWLSSNWGV